MKIRLGQLKRLLREQYFDEADADVNLGIEQVPDLVNER